MTKFIINGTEYTFFNESWSVGYRWGHKSVLYRDGVEIGSKKIRYYNRTWEAYQFQSCMQWVVSELLEELLSYGIMKYKIENNIKRLTADKKEIVVALHKKENKNLFELYSEL